MNDFVDARTAQIWHHEKQFILMFFVLCLTPQDHHLEPETRPSVNQAGRMVCVKR